MKNRKRKKEDTMGFDLGHTINSLAKLVLRTKRVIDKNKESNGQSKKAEVYEEFCTWLDWALTSNGIEQAAAFNFNIYEDGESIWSLELVGTSEFSTTDSDWACAELFATRSHPFKITYSGSWQEVLALFKEYVGKYLESGAHCEVLKSKAGVGIGFVDGDLEILYKNASVNVRECHESLNAKEGMAAEAAIQTIAAIISNNDGLVLEKVKDCLKDTEAYFKKYADVFSERGIEEVDELSSRELQRVALVDILAENLYVCEQDWNDELDDFLYFVGELKETKAQALPLKVEWFNGNGDISEWSAVIDTEWKPFGMCLAAIDIESDCYVLFPCKIDKLNELETLAKTVSYRIDYAKNF